MVDANKNDWGRECNISKNVPDNWTLKINAVTSQFINEIDYK